MAAKHCVFDVGNHYPQRILSPKVVRIAGSFCDKERNQGYKIILPAAAVFSLAIYLLRDFIVSVLFTGEFSEMETLFAWQMVGDTLKIGSWILAYLMLGKAMVKLYFFSELIFAALFYFLTVTLTDQFNLKGVAIAHALNYLIYWSSMAVAIFYALKGRKQTTY